MVTVESELTVLKAFSRSTMGMRRSVVLSPDKVKLLNGTEELDELELLIDDNIRNLFGNVDLEVVLSQRFQSLGVYDENDKLAGLVVLNIYPNISSVSPRDWEEWVSNLYGMTDVNSRNTVWVHLLLYDKAYYNFFLTPIMQYLFKSRSIIKYCIMIVPPGKHKTDFFNNHGIPVLPRGEEIPKRQNQYLYVMTRKNFVLHYKLRKAVEEDNDDIIPLIDSYCPILKEMYGSYYIAEILTKYKDSGRQIVVAEFDGVPVGVLGLNENVNYEVLNSQFELVPYNGLKKPDPSGDSTETISSNYTVLELKSDDTINFHESDKTDWGIIKSSPTEALEEDSDEFSVDLSTNSIYIFLDDDDGPITFSMGETEEPQFPFFHFLDKWVINPNDDLEDLRSCSRIDSQHEGIYSQYRYRSMVPEFHGEPNAFAIEIVAAHQDHQNSLMELFEAAFHCFSDREYAIITLPSTLSVAPEFKYFGRVARRPTCEFPHELYALHRSSLLGKVHVKELDNEYPPMEIKTLLRKVRNNNEILLQVQESLRPNAFYRSFILLCKETLIGIATVKPMRNFEHIRAHFNISMVYNPRVHYSDRHGVIENALISPVFQKHANYFLREVHRFSQFDILYYKLGPNDVSPSHRTRPLMNFMPNMLHVMPRRQVEYDLKVLEENECLPPKEITSPSEKPFSLFISTVPICGVHQYIVNQKIVVLGCTTVSLSFIEALVLEQDPYFRMLFHNVSVICQAGTSFDRSSRQDIFFVKKHFIDTQYFEKVGFKVFVNFVQGIVTKINRKEKTININENFHIKYDYLFLMCGEIFSTPKPLNKYQFEEKPHNVFVINTYLDVNSALMILKRLRQGNKDGNYRIIIYGHHLQAYCTLEALLQLGIPGKNLTFIENFPYTVRKLHKQNVSIFNNPDIDRAVSDNILKQGIKIYSSYNFNDWTCDPVSNLIKSAKFESRHKMLELDCIAMFCFNDKVIHHRIKKVIKEAGLVYDGRLVIDANCRTNDPNIYAAGTLTKYSRKYDAQTKSHKYYNRMEIGHRLGRKIKQMLSPNTAKQMFVEKPEWNMYLDKSRLSVPIYQKPVMRYCRLPYGLYYLSIVKPGRTVPLESALTNDDFGRILITGDLKDLNNHGFFRLHLNNNRRVETITCLTKFPLDIQNLYCLWGKNEKLLNNLSQRFEMMMITDFFDYFREPWAYAIYHDKFNDLMEELNDIMTSAIGFSGTSILNKIISEYKNVRWRELSRDTEKNIKKEFDEMPYAKIIEQKVLDFLKDNITHLPMYAHPLIIRDILRNFEASPMFT